MAHNKADKDDEVLSTNIDALLKVNAQMCHGYNVMESNTYQAAFAAAASFHQQLLMSPLTQALFLPFLSPTFSYSPDFSSFSQSLDHQLQQQYQHQHHHQHKPSPCCSPRSCQSASESCESERSNSQCGNRKSAPTLATGRRNLKSENVTQQENHRRALRREKNRQAAAKCRQKRQDCIALLEAEVEELEQERAQNEHQLGQLQLEARRLSKLLELHKDECQARDLPNSYVKQSLRSQSNASCSLPKTIAFPTPVETVKQACQRPSNLPLPTLHSAPSQTTLDTPGNMISPSSHASGSTNWETNESLGLTPLLFSMDTPKDDRAPFPGLIEVTFGNNYSSSTL